MDRREPQIHFLSQENKEVKERGTVGSSRKRKKDTLFISEKMKAGIGFQNTKKKAIPGLRSALRDIAKDGCAL